MSIFSKMKERSIKNEISADSPSGNTLEKLLELLGIDQTKPKAIAETTYFTCLKALSETMGKMTLKFYK